MCDVKISPLNSAEIDEVLHELNLVGSFLREIIQPDYKSLILIFYCRDKKNTRVMLDLDAQKTAIYPLKKSDKRKNLNLRFLQMLRAHCAGGYIVDVFQYNAERILVFHVKHSNKLYCIYVRLWGARGNIFLCNENNTILDVFYRRPNSNEARGNVFILPPLKGVVQTYNLRAFPGEGSFAENVYNFFYQYIPPSSSKENFLEWYEEEKKRLDVEISEIDQHQRENKKLIKEYAIYADLLMGYLHMPLKMGQTHLEIEDEIGNFITVPLDNEISLVANAQIYYEKRRNVSHKNEFLAAKIKKLEEQKSLLQQQYVQIEAGLLSPFVPEKTKVNPKNAIPGLLFVVGDYVLLVGRSAQENDFLLRHIVKSHEWWFHIRGYSGSYVFIRIRKGQALTDKIQLDACALATHYSKARGEGSVEIYCTQVKYLRRIKGAIGKVIPQREKTITYRVETQRIAEILNLNS